MKYDQDRIAAIERTWLTPNWVPAKEFVAKAGDDVAYLLTVITELKFKIAELQNHVLFNTFKGD